MRGPNLIIAQPQRMESENGRRWACGRNVKRSLPDRRYDGVEVWSLRTRDENGKVVVVATHRSREEASAWVKGENPPCVRRFFRR